MAIPLIHLPLNENLEGSTPSGDITATGTGAVRFEDGAVFIEEGTTNLHDNPFLENGSTRYGSYDAAGSSISAELDTSSPYAAKTWKATIVTKGSTFAVLQSTTAVPLSPNVTTQQPFTAQVWVACNRTKQLSVNIRRGTTVGNQWSPTQVTSVGPVPTLITATTETDPTRTTQSLTLELSINGPSVGDGEVGDTLWLWHPQFENKPYATSFCPSYKDGVLQPGYAWSGTPYASTSTRTAGAVTVGSAATYMNSEKGSALIQHKALSVYGANRYLFYAGASNNAGSDWVALTTSASNSGALRGHWRSGTSTQNSTSTPYHYPALGNWEWAYIEWEGTTVRIRAPGGHERTVTRNTPVGSWLDSIIIGSPSIQQYNGFLKNFVLFGSPLADSKRLLAIAALEAGAFEFTTLVPHVTGVDQEIAPASTRGTAIQTFAS